jgi:NAD binding domain of 6-phosphogluconate dehydrogenase
MTEVAFLGQGNMGVPMASRLVAARHRVTVWNRTKDKSATAREQGAQVAGTAADAVRDADVVVTMLRDADAVDAALFDYERAADALASGRCCWRCRPSDRPPSWTCAARLRADVALVDAPVVGSIPQATAGELRISLSCSPWGAWRGGSRAVSYPSGPQNIVRRFSRPPHIAPGRPLVAVLALAAGKAMRRRAWGPLPPPWRTPGQPPRGTTTCSLDDRELHVSGWPS